MQEIIVGVILLSSAGIAAVKIYKSFRPKKSTGCSGGCSGCPMKEPCDKE